MRFAALPLLLAVAACDPDPARSVRLEPKPATTVAALLEAQPSSSYSAGHSAGRSWVPEGCPPLPEAPSGGPSDIKATGPCAFEHHGLASCQSLQDDFFVAVTRPARNGAQLMVYINVEQYHGPGHYSDSQIFVGLQDAKSIYRWSTGALSIDVAHDEKSVTFPETLLLAEPRLEDCTGPMTNFQCNGTRRLTPMNGTVEKIGGTFLCGDSAIAR